MQFKFGIDGDGNYGYYGADDSLIPFKRAPLSYGSLATSDVRSPTSGGKIIDETCFKNDDPSISGYGSGYTQMTALKNMKIHIYLNCGIRGNGGSGRVYKNDTIVSSNSSYGDREFDLELVAGDYLRFWVAAKSGGQCSISWVIV